MNADQLLVHYEQIADAPDAIVRLRRFILDLAMRGKLVEQDPTDEPASELLKRIAVEKARLAKAGKIRKPKLLPEIEEHPYVLPPSWRWTRMRQVTSDRGQAVPDAPFTYIDVTAIDKENGFVSDPKVLQANEAPSRARKIVRQGDVIYSCVRPYLLNVAIVDADFDPAPIASTAFAILNGHGLVLPRYLWIVLRSPFMVECVEQDMRGQAYPAINDSDFSVLPFPLPPLTEQDRIVAKVDELMALCDRLEAARAEREATRDRLAAASLARLNAPDPDAAAFQTHATFALDNLAPLTNRPDQIKALRQTSPCAASWWNRTRRTSQRRCCWSGLVRRKRKSLEISASSSRSRSQGISDLTKLHFLVDGYGLSLTNWLGRSLTEIIRHRNVKSAAGICSRREMS